MSGNSCDAELKHNSSLFPPLFVVLVDEAPAVEYDEGMRNDGAGACYRRRSMLFTSFISLYIPLMASKRKIGIRK